MKKRLFICLLGLGLSFPALAHEGHSHDPLHQHRRIQGVEVALQVMPAKMYQNYLKARKLPLTELSTSHVLVVVLEQNKRWLDTRVRLKVTQANGENVGAAAGLDPQIVREAAGPHYAFPISLHSGEGHFVMVQFAGQNGLQRAGFELPALPKHP